MSSSPFLLQDIICILGSVKYMIVFVHNMCCFLVMVVRCRESFFVKVALGYGSQMHEYIMNVDTGSGSTWVNCLGKGEIDEMVI